MANERKGGPLELNGELTDEGMVRTFEVLADLIRQDPELNHAARRFWKRIGEIFEFDVEEEEDDGATGPRH